MTSRRMMVKHYAQAVILELQQLGYPCELARVSPLTSVDGGWAAISYVR